MKFAFQQFSSQNIVITTDEIRTKKKEEQDLERSFGYWKHLYKSNK